MNGALLYTDGHFYTDNGYKSAILVDNGLITRLFEAHEEKPSDCTQISLKGAWAYPGFVDTHTHSFEGGLYSNGVDLSDSGSIAELLDRLREGLRHLEPGKTLFAWRFDENELMERRFPSLSELDSLDDSKAIVMRRVDGHSCMVNSFGRRLLGARIGNDEILRAIDNDRAVHFFHGSLDGDTILAAYHRAAQIALQGGFVGVHTMIGDADMSITHYSLIRDHLDQFPINYHIYPQSFNLPAAIDAAASRIGGCILADGSIGSHTAALEEPYIGTKNKGILYQTDEFWHRFVESSHKAGLQVAVHCIGDKAIRQINSAYLTAEQADPKGLRHQLIHCELCTDQLLDEIVASGAVAVMQPSFDYYWGASGGLYERNLGSVRTALMNRFASITKRGIKLCFGSDWYVTPLDALLGIWVAVNHHNPMERISPQDAVAAYTTNAAYLSGEEDLAGKLEPGMRADISLVNCDLLKAFDREKAQILGVIRRGELVYDQRQAGF